MATWLRDHDYSITADKVTREFWPQAEPAEREELVEKHPDFVVVLGGDGTLLSTARSVAHAGIPILGVNLGSLGFLTEIRHDEINEALEAVDAGKCDLSLRSMLHCQVRRGDECLANYDALNECVLNQSAVARINEFELLIDGVFVANYKADGLIISTPDRINRLFAGCWRPHPFPGPAGVCHHSGCIPCFDQPAAGGAGHSRDRSATRALSPAGLPQRGWAIGRAPGRWRRGVLSPLEISGQAVQDAATFFL